MALDASICLTDFQHTKFVFEVCQLTLPSCLQKPETEAKNGAKEAEDTPQIGAQQPETTAQNGVRAPDPIGDDNGANNAVNTTAVGPEETPNFTTEQDARLLEMKADGKSTWKQIAAELSKSPNDLKKRFKELKAGGNADRGGEGGDKEEGGGGDKDEGGGDGKSGGEGGGDNEEGGNERKGGGGGDVVDEGTGKKKKDRKGKGKEKAVNVNKSGPVGETGAEPAFTLSEWRELTRDDEFSPEELQILADLVKKDREREWLRIASGFYDKTGRRVHEDDIKEKFAELKVN